MTFKWKEDEKKKKYESMQWAMNNNNKNVCQKDLSKYTYIYLLFNWNAYTQFKQNNTKKKKKTTKWFKVELKSLFSHFNGNLTESENKNVVFISLAFLKCIMNLLVWCLGIWIGNNR